MAARITLAIGGEPLLIDRAVEEAVAAVREEHPGAQLVAVDAGDHEHAPAAIAQAMSPTLFGDITILLLRGLDGADEETGTALLAALADLPEDTYLIVTHPGVVKGKALLEAVRKAGAQQMDCAVVKKGRATEDFLVKELRRHRRRMEPEAIRALQEAVGQDLRMLAAAAAQLAQDVDHDPITLADVRLRYSGVAEVSGFAIADAVWDRSPEQALLLLRQAMQSSDSVHVPTVAAIASGLRAIVRVAGLGPGASEADAAREAGVPPWKVRTLRRQWSLWSGDQRRLAAAVISLADADAAIKGGVGSALDVAQKEAAIERLVLVSGRRAAT